METRRTGLPLSGVGGTSDITSDRSLATGLKRGVTS